MPKLISILLLSALWIYGCSTTKIIDKNPPPYRSDVSLLVNSGNAVFNFSMKAIQNDGQDKFDFINAITTVKLEILTPEDTVFHNLEFTQLDIKGTTEKEKQTSLTVSGSVSWMLPLKFNLEDMKFRFKIFANNKFYDITKTYDDIYTEAEEDMPALTLEPFIENQTYNSAVFGVIAKRNKTVENEYIPTSETFRVDILNQKEHVVWSSSYGQNFLQVLNPVLPASKGETHKYTMEWNGKTSNQIPLTAGEYTLRMTIPAKPTPYTTSMRFNWNQ
ncbi:MAG: hypothetical protein A2X61_11330 [Ignavibacteria bacterium GWB2_35_12]|nr:MAG: hypothetical protein A2X63_01700 [Ignavibacteria bacterium GWA2_35_8]OGU39625.1 MAG: hypothetical protein A2X61_11330 [Ignavibacteria bacterium GWB2_35_12]OGU89770.1 MAG: hypothetical protein A2220_02895 [Ignavibacteria bacterium RIFOXYA2_FULL_35_10]OGV24027.1 MAG: hypothetical protein A2475_10975 [Ignavibacteria bacterium RIFOXYC2_FULL_35_21]